MHAHSRSQNCQAQPTAARVSPAPCSAASLKPALPSLLQAVSGSPDSLARYRASMLKEFLRQARSWRGRCVAAAGQRRQLGIGRGVGSAGTAPTRRLCCAAAAAASSAPGQHRHSRVVLHTTCQARRWCPVPAHNKRKLGNPCLTRMPVASVMEADPHMRWRSFAHGREHGSFKGYSSLI